MQDQPLDKHPSEIYQNADVPDESPSALQPTSLREAAVLIPLMRLPTGWEILYIKRTENHDDRHSGQVAFPGGAREPEDVSLVETALRETEEEIGLSRQHIQVVDTLMPYQTISHYCVTPVVGVVHWPVSLKLAADEVARTFTIPLDWLQQPDNFELRARQRPPHGRGSSGARPLSVVYFRPYDGEILWGASARMTLNFLKLLDDGHLPLPE